MRTCEGRAHMGASQYARSHISISALVPSQQAWSKPRLSGWRGKEGRHRRCRRRRLEARTTDASPTPTYIFPTFRSTSNACSRVADGSLHHAPAVRLHHIHLCLAAVASLCARLQDQRLRRLKLLQLRRRAGAPGPGSLYCRHRRRRRLRVRVLPTPVHVPYHHRPLDLPPPHVLQRRLAVPVRLLRFFRLRSSYRLARPPHSPARSAVPVHRFSIQMDLWGGYAVHAGNL